MNIYDQKWHPEETHRAVFIPMFEKWIGEELIPYLDDESIERNINALDLSDKDINPAIAVKLLEELGWTNNDIDRNGWQMDFWATMSHPNGYELCVEGCGYTFNMALTVRE